MNPVQALPTQSSTSSSSDLDDDVEQLAHLLQRTEDASARADICDQMVLRALPLADSLARRYSGRGIEVDDLVQVARMAAVKAVRKYRPGAGPGFSAYAVPTICGEIKRCFRDHGWSVRPPRRLQELRIRVQSEEDQLRHTLLRDPTDAEVAAAVGCCVDEVREARACSAGYHAVSLELPTASGKPLAELVLGTPCPSGEIVVRDALHRAVAALDDRQKHILRLRFTDELTQTQIAERIGVSQMQVSRILSRILARLRELIDDDGDYYRPTG